MLDEKLFVLSQYPLPHHGISRLAGWVADTRIGWIKSPLIRRFIRTYGVDMSEAKRPHAEDYANFNDFFTRELKDGAREIQGDANTIVSPADGAISQFGNIDGQRLIQAKGQEYDLLTLLGNQTDMADQFENGQFMCIYLSPKDYHRLHMPLRGRLIQTCYVPGRLFSVNPATAQRVPNLFARNERLVCMFETQLGPMVMVLVGAMIVAAIETVWTGKITPFKKLDNQYFDLYSGDLEFEKGEEMGRFCLGSTVILCFPQNSMNWQADCQAGQSLKMGQALGSITS